MTNESQGKPEKEKTSWYNRPRTYWPHTERIKDCFVGVMTAQEQKKCRRRRSQTMLSKLQSIMGLCREIDTSCRRKSLAVVPEQQHKESEFGSGLERPCGHGQRTQMGARQGRADKSVGSKRISIK